MEITCFLERNKEEFSLCITSRNMMDVWSLEGKSFIYALPLHIRSSHIVSKILIYLCIIFVRICCPPLSSMSPFLFLTVIFIFVYDSSFLSYKKKDVEHEEWSFKVTVEFSWRCLSLLYMRSDQFRRLVIM